MKKKKPTPIENFLALSDAQKDAEVDRLIALPCRAWKPLTPAQRKQWARIKRKMKMGRPMVGEGAKQISVTMELDRLKRVDRYAKAHGLKRTQVIAQGVDLLMSRAGKLVQFQS
jgi:hypothetical protein